MNTQAGWEPKPTRVLLMTLTDGQDEIKAMEYKPLAGFGVETHPGAKVGLVVRAIKTHSGAKVGLVIIVRPGPRPIPGIFCWPGQTSPTAGILAGAYLFLLQKEPRSRIRRNFK